MGTKLDLKSEKPDEYVSESKARKACKRFEVGASLQCSALELDNVDKVFIAAIECGLRNMGLKTASRLPRCEIV